ncbi:MAG: hypothetical protein QW667_06030 [Candidatus Bathyarchaeia archaeon]
MSATLQKNPEAIATITQGRELNAEAVTTIATNFLKRIGHKSGLKPKRVSPEEGAYTVEIEMKKLLAVVKVDAATRGIKEYEIQQKSEETSMASFSPKMILIIVGVSAAIHIALNFAFKMFGL